METRRVLTPSLSSAVAVAGAAAAACALLAPSAGAAKVTKRFSAYKVGSLPGTPAKYNKVFVTKYGPSRHNKVLVLIPGTNGGAGNFSLIGPELARRVPGLQVWAMDRREQALEDTSMMRKAAAGKATAQQLVDFYLPGTKQQYKPHQPKDFAFMKNWGMQMQVEDARVVVRQAARGGRKVILGGHSLGASMAAAYATWDFGGKGGYRDIKGIVAIDGGLSGTPSPNYDTTEKAQAALDNLDPSKDGPWGNLLRLPGFAWITGPFVEIGAFGAHQAPTGPSVLQTYPLISAVPGLQPPGIATDNAASLGYAFDYKTSPSNLALVQVRSGELAPSGDPRGWIDNGITPVQNIARGFMSDSNGTNGADWYYPSRLNVDTGGAAGIDPNSPGAKVLGLRINHLAEVNVPYYAFQTSLSGGTNGVINGATSFAERSKVPKSGLVLVDRATTTSHLDPLLAAPAKNDFIKTVVPFLKKIR